MSTATVLRARYPRVAHALSRYAKTLEPAGKMANFVRISIFQIGWAVRQYRSEVVRLIAEVGMGTGALAVIGGTVSIIGFTSLAGGSVLAIQGFSSLGNIGADAFTGFFAALTNTRAMAPLIAGIALAATVGAGATAELGAMRISEEIDALEVMGINSIAFLTSTRVVAGMVVIMPVYTTGLILSFLAPQFVTTAMFGQSMGTYQHYFWTFMRVEDLAWSCLVAAVIAGVVMVTHCYYGYTASGGPVGVGEAVGRSMRLSLVTVPIVVLCSALVLYGADPNFNLSV